MDKILLFALLGLGSGALIAALALGIVLTYRGSGTINLATGAIAMMGAYVFYGLKTGGYLIFTPFDFGAPFATVPAIVVTLIFCALAGMVVEYILVRPLRNSTPLAKLVGSLGVMLFIQAVAILRFGSTPLQAEGILPSDPVRVFGVPVPEDRFILFGIVAVVTVVLVSLYRFTGFGFATRAAAENETSAMLIGLAPNRLSVVNTVMAYLVMGALGILVAPLLQLDPTNFPLQVVPALAAALLARFSSFTIAAVVGVLIGMGESILYYLSTLSWFPKTTGQAIPGVQELLIFLVIIVTVYLRGDVLPRRGFLVEQRLPAVPRPEGLARKAAIAIPVIVVALLVLPPLYRQASINTMLAIVLSLSLIVITGYVGQISFAQLALGGVAGFILSKLAVHLGIGFPLGPIIAVGGAVLFGLATAVPALRIRGVSLAVVSLAAAVALESFGFRNTTWGAVISGSDVPSPHLFSINLGNDASFPIGGDKLPSPVIGFVVLTVLVVLCMVVAHLPRTALGYRMLAVRSNESAAAAVGINVRNVKLTAFGLASAIAGIAGVLYAYNFGTVSASRFGTITALNLVALVYIGGISSVYGAVLASFITAGGIMAVFMDDVVGVPQTYALLLGAVGVIYTVVKNPEGIAGAAAQQKERKRLAKAEKQRQQQLATTEVRETAGVGS